MSRIYDVPSPVPPVRRSRPLTMERAREIVTKHRPLLNILALVDGPPETIPFGQEIYAAMQFAAAVDRMLEPIRRLQEAMLSCPFTNPRSFAWLKEMRAIHAPYGLVHGSSREGRHRREARHQERLKCS